MTFMLVGGERPDDLKRKRLAELAQQQGADAERKRLEEAARAVRDANISTPPVSVPPVTSPAAPIIVAYQGLEFEHPAYRLVGETEKALLRYDESLARLVNAGFVRHPRSQEVFGLLCDGLKNKLGSAEKKVYDDMLVSYGEWFNLAMERQGNDLLLYEDPELEWNGKIYVKKPSMKGAPKKFNVAGIESNKWIPAKQFDEPLVKECYGRSFAQLPPEMREGNYKAHIIIPDDGILWPVGRGLVGYRFIIYGFSFSNGASRGVRP